MYKIAVCGKGGVGKSAVSANLSYILSTRGAKVLHVGCDPKHDSTRLLTGGIPQKTYLDHLFDDPESDVIVVGENGIGCVECGGAEPGIGCAGKGLMSLFKYLDENSPDDIDYRVCDILGDVVCGGFAVPLRRNNVDGIILVVSEDFMSIYAANNILRGIRNLGESPRILGMVLNSRNPDDRWRINEFSRVTGMPILATIPNDPLFSEVEAKGITAAEAYPDSEPVTQLSKLADIVESAASGEFCRGVVDPLSDDTMMQIAICQPIVAHSAPTIRKRCSFDRFDIEKNQMQVGKHVMAACSSHGAVELLLGITDAAVVLNGPANCAYLMEYIFRRKSVQMANDKGVLTPCNLYSTNLTDVDVFKGDGDAIRSTVLRAYQDGFRTIFVVGTCTPEIMGTDVGCEVSKMDLPDAEIIVVPENKVFLGSKFGGFREAVFALASMIDRSRSVESGTAAILSFEINCATHRGKKQNMDMFAEMLEDYGIRLKTFIRDITTIDEIRDLATCEHLIQISHGSMPDLMSKILFPEREVIVMDPPMSMDEIGEWCDMLSKLTGNRGNGYYERKKAEYDTEIARIRPQTEGTKAVFYTRQDKKLNAQMDVLRDLGMEVSAIFSWPVLVEYHDPWDDRYPDVPRITGIDICRLRKECEKMGVDLIVSGDLRTGRTGFPWFRYPSQYLGMECALEFAHRVRNAMIANPRLEWRD